MKGREINRRPSVASVKIRATNVPKFSFLRKFSGPATRIQPLFQDHGSSLMKRIFTDLQNDLADLVEGERQEDLKTGIFLSSIFLSA
jgi:hypothetical protein